MSGINSPKDSAVVFGIQILLEIQQYDGSNHLC